MNEIVQTYQNCAGLIDGNPSDCLLEDGVKELDDMIDCWHPVGTFLVWDEQEEV